MIYKKLGDCIQLVSKRNSDDSIQNVVGINIAKYFMPSVANIIDTDLTKYKVIKKWQFACNRMHVGRDNSLPVAMYIDEHDAIVSPAYDVFEVKNVAEILPEYLLLFFSRSEFDRECWFHTDADVRSGLNWQDLINITLPVPPIEEQKEIVRKYKVITDRIKVLTEINKKLEETACELYKSWFVSFEHNAQEDFDDSCIGMIPNSYRLYKLKEFLPVVTGKKNAEVSSEVGKYPFFSCSQNIAWTNDFSFDADAILVAGNGDFNVKFYKGKFEAYQRTYVLIPDNKKFAAWLYYVIKYNMHDITTAARGSVISFITKGSLENLTFAAPKNLENLHVIKVFDSINRIIGIHDKEISLLTLTRNTLLPRLMQE